MTTSAAARHVVERCPSCGVEHDVPAHSVCDACHTPLRAWCRVHGREAGWLDGPACPRCDREAERPTRPPAVRGPVPGLQAPAAVAALPQAPLAEVAPAAAQRAPRPDAGVMFLILFIAVAGGAFGGMVLSTPFVLGGGSVHLDTLVEFLVAGGIAGLLFGVYCCRGYVRSFA